MLGVPCNEPHHAISFIRLDPGSCKYRYVRSEVIRVEIKQFFIGINFYVFFPEIFPEAQRRDYHIRKRHIQPVLPSGMVSIFKVDTGFMKNCCNMCSTDGAKPDKYIRPELSCHEKHPDIQQGNIDHFFRKGFSVTSQFLIHKPVVIQQPVRDFLPACGDKDCMTPLFHPPDKVFKKMDICRVIDIDYNSHGRICTTSMKKAPVVLR